MSYRTIVVGTDGSPTASVAVEVAQKLAKRHRGRLVLVGALDAYGISRQPLQTALYEAAEAARAKKVDAVAELIEGTPGESILAAAVKHDADLIVVGNRGMGQATRFRLGSVPDWVAHDAPCDLLIVDTTGRAGPRDPAPPYSRILAGTDGSGTATEAVRKAYTLASMYAGTVTLVHVGDPVVGAIKLEEVAGAKPEDVEVERRVVEGDPAQRICGARGGRGRPARRRREQGDVRRAALPRLRAEQGGPRGALRRPDREDGGPVGRRHRAGARRARERRGATGRVLPGRRGADRRALTALHAHGMHGRLERLAEDVGLPVSRLALRGRRLGRAGDRPPIRSSGSAARRRSPPRRRRSRPRSRRPRSRRRAPRRPAPASGS